MLVPLKAKLNFTLPKKSYAVDFFNNFRKHLCFHKKNKVQKKLILVSVVNISYLSLHRRIPLFSLSLWKKINYFFGIKRRLVAFFNLYVFKNLFKFFCVKQYFFFKYIVFFKDIVNYLQFVLFKYFNFSFVKGYFTNLSYVYNMYFYYQSIQTFAKIKNKKGSFYPLVFKKFKRILNINVKFRNSSRFNIFASKKITFLRYCSVHKNFKKGSLGRAKTSLYFLTFVAYKNYLFQTKNITYLLKKRINNIIFLQIQGNSCLLNSANNLLLVYNLKFRRCFFELHLKLCISFTLYMSTLLKSVNLFIDKINMNFKRYIKCRSKFAKYTYYYFLKNSLVKRLVKKRAHYKVVKKAKKKLSLNKKKPFFLFLSKKKHKNGWRLNFFLKKKIKFLRKNVSFSNKYFYRFLYSRYLQLFSKNFFVRFFYVNYLKKFLGTIFVTTPTLSVIYPNVKYLNTNKNWAFINFNKMYILYTQQLNLFKNINYNFFKKPVFFQKFNMKFPVSGLSRFKQNFIYFKYMISLDKQVKRQPADKVILKKERRAYLYNFLSFFKERRFFFSKLTLFFFWKKRSIDYIYAPFLKRYRFVLNNLQKKINKNEIFINFKFPDNSIFERNAFLKLKTIFKYKQVSLYFFKYKYYLYLKTSRLLETCFLYTNNYLSFNFNYFWFLYIFAYIFSFSIATSSNNLVKANFKKNISYFSTNVLNYISVDNYNLLASSKNSQGHRLYYNFFFKIVLKYLLAKYFKVYKKSYNTNIYTWKKQFSIYKKFYKNFAYKLQKRSLKRKLKFKFKKRLKLRLKYNLKSLRIKKLTFFNTCGYYNYFKRRIFIKSRIFTFFHYGTNNIKKQQSKHLAYLNIIQKIGIINICILNNNTYATLTDLYGNIRFVCSGGIVGLKGPKRSTSVASEEVTAAVYAFLEREQLFTFIILKFSGVLYSRKIKEAFKVFTVQKDQKKKRKDQNKGQFNFKILRIFNNTPKSHNGIRLKKKRRG